jgi:hypothetical protein
MVEPYQRMCALSSSFTSHSVWPQWHFPRSTDMTFGLLWSWVELSNETIGDRENTRSFSRKVSAGYLLISLLPMVSGGGVPRKSSYVSHSENWGISRPSVLPISRTSAEWCPAEFGIWTRAAVRKYKLHDMTFKKRGETLVSVPQELILARPLTSIPAWRKTLRAGTTS